MLRAFVNLKLTYKLLLPVAVLVAVTCGIVWHAESGMKTMAAATQRIVDVEAERLATSLTIARAVNEAAVQEKNIILESGEEAMRALEVEYRRAIALGLENADRLIALADTAERRAGNERLKAELQRFAAVTDRSVALGRRNESEAAMKVSMGEVRPARRAIMDLIDERVARNRTDMARAKAEAGTLADNTARTLLLITAAGLTLALTLVVAIAVLLVARPLGAMAANMGRLANGDLAAEVHGAERTDEVGQLARAMQVFKETALAARDSALRLAEQERRTEEQTRAARLQLADGFEASVGGIVKSVASVATELQAAAQTMTGTASAANQQATTVSIAADRATTNVQTVAAAAEELSASVAEISRRLTESAAMARRSEQDASRTSATVQGLAEGAHNIGEVVGLITSIASQTNLLALNATIEAARAGEAGKGFAVVASEVKSLAAQTAKATESIAAQINAIQGSTTEVVSAIQGIVVTIQDMSQVAAAIAAAVEEQGAATQEIARNVTEAAQGTNEVSSNVQGLTRASGDVGAAAGQVLGSAGDLSRQAESLGAEVRRFLDTVRAA